MWHVFFSFYFFTLVVVRVFFLSFFPLNVVMSALIESVLNFLGNIRLFCTLCCRSIFVAVL